MPRAKKDCKPFSLRMDTATFDRLEQFCDESGQMKTVAVERAINMYINEWDKKKEKLAKTA